MRVCVAVGHVNECACGLLIHSSPNVVRLGRKKKDESAEKESVWMKRGNGLREIMREGEKEKMETKEETERRMGSPKWMKD